MVSRRRLLLAAVPIALVIGPAVSAAAPPVSIAPPAIDGLVLLDGAVNCREGDWENVPDRIDVNWTRDGAPIAGADGRQYAIAEQDIGHQLRCVETAFEGTAKATATSAAVIPHATAATAQPGPDGCGGPQVPPARRERRASPAQQARPARPAPPLAERDPQRAA